MAKRILAGPLWLVATWAMYDLVASLGALPHAPGPVLGLLLATFVVADPRGLFWPRRRPGRTPRVIRSARPTAALMADTTR